MRRLAAIVFAALLLPGYVTAQVSPQVSFNNVNRSSGWSYIPTNSNQDGASTDLAITSNGSNGYVGLAGFWAGYDGRLVVGHSTQGVVNARVYTGIQVIGPNTTDGGNGSENNALDAVAYGGWQQVALERYDVVGGARVPVAPYHTLGVYCFTAFDGTSTNCNAGLNGFTTETQVHGSNEGSGTFLFYTPNGSTGLLPGLTLSAGGKGGVSVGSTNVIIPTNVPTDLGNGTINAASDIATGGHFEARAASAPSAGSCGTSPSIAGSDQAGYVTLGSSVTSCAINFGTSWKNASGSASTPVCQVQLYNATAPTIALSSKSATSISVNFGAGYSGVWSYICMGVG